MTGGSGGTTSGQATGGLRGALSNRDAERLHHAQHDRPVARVLA